MPVTGESKRRSYEGLNEASAALWRRWLELYEDRFERFFYNVLWAPACGPPRISRRK